MPRNYTTEIDGDEYIGESLEKINDNFFNLDNLQQTLSAVSNEVAGMASLALDIGAAALTGIRDINLRLADKGVYYSPHAFYVSITGADSAAGTISFPFRTIDKAINAITNVAKNTPRDESTINKINDYYIVLKEASTYPLSSDITLGSIPGTVHIFGATTAPIASATISKPSNTVHQPFTNELAISSTFVFEMANAGTIIKGAPSFKIFQSFGKNVIPIPGYVNYSSGTVRLTGFNTLPFTQILSSVRSLENKQDDRYYNYILVGNEVKEIDKVISDNILDVTTNFTSTASGMPLFLGNKQNYYYSAVPNESYQALSADNGTSLNSYDTEAVTISAGGNGQPLVEGQTKFETSNILYFNGTASLVVSAVPLGRTNSGRTFLDNTGTLFTNKYLSKTQLPAGDTSVQGVVGYIPFFSKGLYELYRGVYDRIVYDTLLVHATANNYDRPTSSPSYFRTINTTKIPRSVTLRMPTNSGLVYLQPLPTTIHFYNSASAGFKLNGSRLHLHNVYVRGPRNTTNVVLSVADTIDTRNIGVQANNNSTVIVDSDCAIANFSVGIHANNNSHIVVAGDTTTSIHQQNALTVTDNTAGIIVENNSALQTTGPRLVVAQNYQDAVIVSKGSNLSLQFIDLLHNGGTGLTIKENSTANIGNVCIIGNRYGINCNYNSSLVITPSALQNIPNEQPYAYYSPNFIHCNSNLDINAAAINIAQNSRLVLENANVVKNALSGTSINFDDSSTGVIKMTNIFGTRTNRDDNKKFSIGIGTSHNNTCIENTTIHTAQTAICVRPGASVSIENLLINRANIGILLTDNTNVYSSLTNYPSSNSAIVATDVAIHIRGFNNNITYYGELTDFRTHAISLSGINNYGMLIVDEQISPRIANFTVPVLNTLDFRDNKVRTATYPRRNAPIGFAGVGSISY